MVRGPQKKIISCKGGNRGRAVLALKIMPGTFLCDVCLFFLCVCGFCPGTVSKDTGVNCLFFVLARNRLMTSLGVPRLSILNWIHGFRLFSTIGSAGCQWANATDVFISDTEALCGAASQEKVVLKGEELKQLLWVLEKLLLYSSKSRTGAWQDTCLCRGTLTTA